MDAKQHKEAVLKARVRPRIDLAFTITTKIEGKLAQMQGMQEWVQGSNANTTVLEQRVQEIQQAAAQCTVDLAIVRGELEGLRMKISAPIE